MQKYIGGEYASNDLENYGKGEGGSLNSFFPSLLHYKTISFFETGTDALAYIISKRCIAKQEIILHIPKNYCFEAIERLTLKLQYLKIQIKSIHTYQSISEITDSVDEHLHFIILLHFNCFKPIENLYLKENYITIEDFVQAPLDIKQFTAHYAINSLRKLGNVEVAVAYADAPCEISANSSKYFTYKKEAAQLKTLFFNTTKAELEAKYLTLFKLANDALFTPQIQIANSEEIKVLNLIDFDKILEKRRTNYTYLKSRLLKFTALNILEGEYMYLMIEVKNRDTLKKHLAQKFIFTAIHWADSQSAQSKNILSLPIDHRYDFSDLDRMAAVIKEFYSKF